MTLQEQLTKADTLTSIREWGRLARPNPNDTDSGVQLGAVVEEFAELIAVLRLDKKPLKSVYNLMDNLKDLIYTKQPVVTTVSRNDTLDAMCDIIVTLVLLGDLMGLDVVAGLQEVNRSNWSKFEDGTPVFNEHGKIAKGKDYTPPKLDEFL